MTIHVQRSPASAEQTAIRVVTLEEHFSTSEYLKATRPFTPPEAQASALEARLLDLDDGRIGAMNDGGVDVQVLSLAAAGQESLAPADATAAVRDANDAAFAATQRHPDRFAMFASLALGQPAAAAAELERGVNEMNCRRWLSQRHRRWCVPRRSALRSHLRSRSAAGSPALSAPKPATARSPRCVLRRPARKQRLFPVHRGLGLACRTGDALPETHSCRRVRPLPAVEDHHRTHGREPAVLADPRTRWTAALGHWPRTQCLGLLSRSFRRDHQRLLHRGTAPVRTRGPWRGPRPVLRGLPVPVEHRGAELLKTAALAPADLQRIAAGNAERILRLGRTGG